MWKNPVLGSTWILLLFNNMLKDLFIQRDSIEWIYTVNKKTDPLTKKKARASDRAAKLQLQT